MLEDADIPRSPAWWLKRLGSELADQRAGRKGNRTYQSRTTQSRDVPPGLDLLDSYLRNDMPLRGCPTDWEDRVRDVIRMGRLNVAALIVQAKANRMELRDFRTAAEDDELGDQVARDIAVFNDLPVKAYEITTSALALRRGYGMVIPPAEGERFPRITSEDPKQVITAHDPVAGETIAGLKLYRDDWDATDNAYLYVREDDGEVRKYVARKPGASSIGTGRFVLSQKWEWVGDPETVPEKRMPIVRFRNRLDMGEFETHLDHLDRINDQILNKLVISKLQAFRQVALKGLPDTEEVEDDDGNVTEQDVDYDDAFAMEPGSFWQLPEGVDIWESTPTDFGPVRMAIKDDLEQVASATATPLNTITPDAANGSAEGASLMREEHVAAVRACRTFMHAGWRELMSTAFAFMGDQQRSDITQIQAIWGPIEQYGLQEKANAASQATGSLSRERILTDIWQIPPAEVKAELRRLAGQALLAPGLGQPPSQQG